MNRYISNIFILLFSFIGVIPVFGSTPLITESSQLETNAPDPNYPIENLLDNDMNSVFITSNNYIKEHHFLTVSLPSNFKMEGDDNLVVVLNRPNRLDPNTPTVRNPTAMDVFYSLDGENWSNDVLCRVYFINRGSGTTELSEHLPFANLNERIAAHSGADKTINDVKALKFIVTMNNGKYIIGDGIRPMILGGFQIYKTKAGEKVVDRWVDRFHLDTDINYRYYDYTFENTQGVLHPVNRRITGTNGEGSLESLGGWNYFSQDGKGVWTTDSAYLSSHGVNMPDFSYITSANDTLITNPNLKLQRTATIEHVVYAVQGEPIALQPFYTLPSAESYNENFIHWYDYTTGGQVTDDNHTELLDFAVDASGVFRSKDYGWYTSPLFLTDRKETISDVFIIETVEDYKKYAALVNSGHVSKEAVLMNDLDFKGETVLPIGIEAHPWCGKFYGNNHVLRNMIVELNAEGCGVFGSVTDGALIENLIIDSTCQIISGNGWVGFVGYFRNGGTLTIRGVVNHANIKSAGNSGGILGGAQSAPSKDIYLNIHNCAFTGHINNTRSQENGLIAGWIGRGWGNEDPIKIYVNFSNLITTGTVSNSTSGQELYRFKTEYPNNYVYNIDTSTCYDTNGYQGFQKFSIGDVNSDTFLSAFGGEWEKGSANSRFPSGFPVAKQFTDKIDVDYNLIIEPTNPNRKYGTFATFMHPRDPFSDSENLRPLCKDEFLIVADMAQDFSIENNVNNAEKTIIEPTIQFRHIFRVKDGVKFADENMANEEGNRAFIRKNRRHITATAGKDFQVRLDYPYPVEQTTRGVFYYKINNADYRRICSRYFRVYKDGQLIQDRDEKTGKMWVNNPGNLKDKQEDAMFYATAPFDGQGVRTVGDINYYLCGGGGHFYRMMACNSEYTKEGTYTVQVIGTDYEGHTIKLADSPDVDLLVQEFKITFFPDESSIFATEEELKRDYKDYTNEELEKRYGEPSDKIDFDEYRYLENIENSSLYLTEISKGGQTGKYFRWPLTWEQSNYGFGYNVRHDYAMQMIVNNQLITPYHSLKTVVKNEQNYGKGDGLFDRLFYDTKSAQKGYFYYVNAADDPGIIARLKLKKFCPGSKIHISCWISEFSHSEESANLSFNFVARLKSGERIPLHSHITGYVEQGRPNQKDEEFERRGRWLYVYTSFVPILTDKDFDPSEISHYEVELDNNAKSSLGADYAVDDIRVYTVQPIVYADQYSSVCMECKSVEVRLSSDFDVLLQSLDIPAADKEEDYETVDLYYTFLDKKKYDLLIADENYTYQRAFDESVLRYNYDGEQESYFGKLQFYTYFYKNQEYDPSNNNNSHFAYRTVENGNNLIVFNAYPEDENLRPGKEYIVVLLTKLKGTTFEKGVPDSMDFLVDNECTKKCVLTIKASHVIKIDGEVRKQSEEIDACRNQSPVVQVDLYAPKLDSQGNIIPGQSELVEENAVFDWFDGSMDDFLNIEKDGILLWDALKGFRSVFPSATDLSDEPYDDRYTDTMRKFIAEYSTEDPKGEKRTKLKLAQSSYVFPPLELLVGQTKRDEYVLAIPIPKRDDDRLICTQPTEVHVVVKQRAPRLAQGFSDIVYPEAIDDVPMRISLNRLNAAKTDEEPLILPFRIVAPVSDNVTDMRVPGGGSMIHLVATNDPQYKDLSGEGKKEDELWEVGEVLNLMATNKNKIPEGQVALKFKPYVEFKEGYEYRMRFIFEEMAPQGTDIKGLCSGHVVFTLKVVPEYQEWTGETNLNWNNDANWRRVSSDDILLPNAKDSKYSDFVTDGSNERSFSYAPLDFTKVIIPQGLSVPELFKTTMQSVELNGKKYLWSNDPSENEMADVATSRVQYDMVQRIEDNIPGTFCKPWQAHWCEQIHFESGAEIGHQQYLNYDKAWVDMEVSPTRWYTLASPLQGVVAGDMYLPSVSARQATTYFQDITFNTQDYNRFKPAVFQRSWNLASAIVYNYDGNPGNTTDVKVETTWSNVYNDVRVPYSAGHGFSIKTDLAGINIGDIGKVKFRLPKADTSYLYYTDGGLNGDLTKLNRSNPYKLNPADGKIEVEAATENNKLFLVGNPFMAHMDIASFLKENSNVISPKYWILDGDHQGAAVMGDADDLTGTLENPQYIAPMQGFFVEAINPGKSLTLQYNSDMMATVNDLGSLAEIQTRSMGYSEPTALRIYAKDTGSSAMVVFNDSADKGYDSNEDVMFVSDSSLESPALVYTVAEGIATTINTIPEISSTEIGVISKDGCQTTLLFEGVDSSLGLMIYDANEDSYTDLYDGIELKVNGSTARRFYIVSGINQEKVSGLEITLMSNAVRVTSVEGELSVKLYDINGRLIDCYNEGGTEVMFNLEKGIYIVEAMDAVSNKTQKILVR